MVRVVMFGVGGTTVCRGCQAGRTLGELAKALGAKINSVFGSKVDFRFVDIGSAKDSETYREEIQWIKESGADLPLTLVDGKSVYPGLFTPTMIIYEIRRRLREKGEDQEHE